VNMLEKQSFSNYITVFLWVKHSLTHKN
jgi:hypothetical protein